MQPSLHERFRQRYMGPPAPKNGAIRMTVFLTTPCHLSQTSAPCLTVPQRLQLLVRSPARRQRRISFQAAHPQCKC